MRSAIRRVMISSTARDLPDHRREVMDACLSQGMFPIMMEHLPAEDADAVEASLRMVDECDIYLGVIAFRYGYMPAGYDYSITEMEYRRAAERGIPRLIFLMDESHSQIDLYRRGDEAYQVALKTQRLATFKEHLQSTYIVKFFNSPQDLRAHAINALSFHRSAEIPAQPLNEPQQFSDPIKARFAQANKTIQTLTQEQYDVLKMLRYQKRLAIAGCAGSGKTLIAAEKAIRLDEQGIKTLLICHSYHLARHIKTLVKGTGVQVDDFTSWVYRILEKTPQAQADWNYYQEPSEAELNTAFDKLAEGAEKYEAVIVDEGQDFRADWWLLIEAALTNLDYGILYIFHDDNQALLPFRSKYPITQAPIVLSKNCRNTGKVFELVKRLHPQSPEPHLALSDQGIVEQIVFPSRWARSENAEVSLTYALRRALAILPPQQLVVLTIEPEPIEGSSINGFQVMPRPPWQWQAVLREYLGELPPDLSEEPYPTPDDVARVVEFARRALPDDYEPSARMERISWNVSNDRLYLSHMFGKSLHRLRGFFASPTWADDLPKPPLLQVSSQPLGPDEGLRLYSVSAFKGLEADGVILYMPHPYHGTLAELEASVYVGLSRARLLLYMVVHRDLAAKIPQVMLSYH
jgi:hypothetical protein